MYVSKEQLKDALEYIESFNPENKMMPKKLLDEINEKKFKQAKKDLKYLKNLKKTYEQ